jgi:hypothetical protein
MLQKQEKEKTPHIVETVVSSEFRERTTPMIPAKRKAHQHFLFFITCIL